MVEEACEGEERREGGQLECEGQKTSEGLGSG